MDVDERRVELTAGVDCCICLIDHIPQDRNIAREEGSLRRCYCWLRTTWSGRIFIPEKWFPWTMGSPPGPLITTPHPVMLLSTLLLIVGDEEFTTIIMPWPF